MIYYSIVVHMKKRIAILAWWPSTEHEISLKSAETIYEMIDNTLYESDIIVVDKQGDRFRTTSMAEFKDQYDVVFPIMHGNIGEDGKLQARCELADMPYVWTDLCSSAVCMHKTHAKVLCQEAWINVTPWVLIREWETIPWYTNITSQLWFPLFVKPSNAWSSVGVSKVVDEKTYQEAINMAFQYDTTLLIEQAITWCEVEVAVMGNDDPIASTPGAIQPKEFYSYEEKYVTNDAELLIPAPISEKQKNKVQTLAVQAYRALGCTWLGRVDFFVTVLGEIYFNELNTLPGFTSISMFPKLFEYDGYTGQQLTSKLIAYAEESYTYKKSKITIYDPVST